MRPIDQKKRKELCLKMLKKLEADEMWEFNPYYNKSKFSWKDGRVHWMSDDLVEPVHFLPILRVSNGRYLHINTGTHGDEDGSTIYYQTDEFRNEMKKQDGIAKFLTDCSTF